MEETIVCNRWKDLAGDLLVVTSGLEMKEKTHASSPSSSGQTHEKISK